MLSARMVWRVAVSLEDEPSLTRLDVVVGDILLSEYFNRGCEVMKCEFEVFSWVIESLLKALLILYLFKSLSFGCFLLVLIAIGIISVSVYRYTDHLGAC